MIVGNPRNAGQCPHVVDEKCRAFEPLNAYCTRCGQILRIVPRRSTPFLDTLTRELPVNRRVHIPWRDLPSFSPVSPVVGDDFI